MKKLLFLFLIAGSLSTIQAQDLLLTRYKVFTNYTENCVDINFSPKSTYMTLTFVDNKLEVFDKKFNKIWTYQGNPRVAAGMTTFLPDESYMIFGKFQGYGDVGVLRMADKRVVQRLKAHESYIYDLKLSADGKLLASGGADEHINIWEWKGNRFEVKQVITLPNEKKGVYEIAFSKDKQYLVAVGKMRELLVYQLRKGQYELVQSYPFKPYINCVSFHPSDNYFIAGSDTMLVFQRKKRGFELTQKIRSKGASVKTIDFDDTGKMFLTNKYNGFHIMGFQDGEIKFMDDVDMHQGIGMDVKFSPDKNYVVSSATDKQVIVWQRSDAPVALDSDPAETKGPDDATEITTPEGDGDLDFDVGEKGDNYLLLIGINEYQYWNPLFNASKDTRDVKEILQKKYTFEEANIYEVYNGDATAKGILSKIVEVKEKMSGMDNLLIYFSGHGFYNADIDEGFWIPVDAHKGEETEYLANSTLLKYLKSIPAKHIFLVADACFSGALFSQGSRGYVDNVEQYKSRWALASGRLEFVSDGKQGENSPFANYFIKFLTENGDRRVPVSKLVNFVKVAVANNSDQTPLGNPLKNVGDEGGEFVFYLRD